MKFYNLFHFISFFPSYFFLLELPWVNESSVYTNMTRGTVPFNPKTILFSYHNILILLCKNNGTVILMPLWIHVMQWHIDCIKASTIMVIRMLNIIMICGHLRHLGKIISVIPVFVIQSPQQTHHVHPH